MSEFIHVEPVRYWCHKILPLVYDDSLSYMELLNKVVYKLNEVVNNNNELPAYIAKQIKNYINSGEIKKVVQDILANYSLNVKFPPDGITPAVGDGTVDDTAAFQGCLDYANEHGGLMVFVPAGKYLCGNLTMYSGCSIKGDGRYTTTIVMRGGVSNPFIGGVLDSIQISDITIDGNADIQVNNVDTINATISNALFNNIRLTDGYTLLKINANGGDIQLSNIVFDKCVVRALDILKNKETHIEGSNLVFNDVSRLNGESEIRIATNNGNYFGLMCNATVPDAIEVSGNNNKISAVVKNAVTDYVNTGEYNEINIIGKSSEKHLSGFMTTNVANGVQEICETKTLQASGIVEEVCDSKKVTATNAITETCANKTVTSVGSTNVNCNDIFVNTKEPIKYGEPVKYNKYFNTVPMKDKSNGNYNVLVVGEEFDRLGSQSVVSLQDFGVTGIGDESEAVSAAFAFAKQAGIGKIVSTTDAQFSGINIDFNVEIDFYGHTAHGVRIHEQTNRIKTMFTANTEGLNICFKNMRVVGYTDLTDAGVKPDQCSPIEISNANSVVFDGCTFDSHRAGYYSSIDENMALRKGVLYTILDTANTELRNCIISNCKGEELGFIMAVNKPREYVNGSMRNCEYLAPINTSIIDFIGNTFVFENNTYSYDYEGSIINCFALHLIAKGDTLTGTCGGAFYDNCEEITWQGDTIDISNVSVIGKCDSLCQSAANVCYMHDIHDTANITTICVARLGIGVNNPNNYPYAATTDLVNPQVIISNIKTTGEARVYYEGNIKSVGYLALIDNCDLHNCMQMVTAQNTEMVVVRNTKIKNAIDNRFSGSTGISMNFFYGCPNVIRFDNCNFENLDKAKAEYVTAGTNENTKIFVSNCYSDTTNVTGNVVSNAGTFKTANNIGIKDQTPAVSNTETTG